MKRFFQAVFAVFLVCAGWLLVGEGKSEESRSPLSPGQEKAIDAALEKYIRFLAGADTARVECASTSVHRNMNGTEHDRSEFKETLILKRPCMMRRETFQDDRLTSITVYDRTGKWTKHGVAKNKTWVDDDSGGPLNGWQAERDPLPFYYYPCTYLFSPDLEKRRASLKKLAVSAGVEELSGVACQVIEFRKGQDRSRLWIAPDGSPRRCLYESDRSEQDPPHRYASDTVFTSVKIGVEAPDSLFTFTPPKGGKIITSEDANNPDKALLPKGAEAPDFACVDLAGRPVRLSDYRGKVVLLNFWDFG